MATEFQSLSWATWATEKAQVVEALEIQPKLSTCVKEISERQGGVARDNAPSIRDLRNAISRRVRLSRQFSRVYAECLRFLGWMITGMAFVVDDLAQFFASGNYRLLTKTSAGV